MTRRMPGGGEDGHAAVTEYVAVPFQFCDGMRWLEPRFVIGAGPFVFGFLHVKHCRGKHLDISDVIGVRVRARDRLDVGRGDTELLKLRRQGFRAAPEHRLWIGRRKAVRHRRDRVRYAGVPQEPALCVFDQIAIVDEVHRLAFVDTGRPARNIAGDALTAIENVEFLDTGLASLRESEIDGKNHCKKHCQQST